MKEALLKILTGLLAQLPDAIHEAVRAKRHAEKEMIDTIWKRSEDRAAGGGG